MKKSLNFVFLISISVILSAQTNSLSRQLLNSVASEDIPTITSLLKQGADPNKQDGTAIPPLSLACNRSNLEIVSLLLKANANPNFLGKNQEFTPLLFSVAGTEEPEIVYLLIKAGADVNFRLGKQWTPIFYSVSLGHDTVTKILLDAGADITLKDDENMTPMDVAKKTGRQGSIKLLNSREDK